MAGPGPGPSAQRLQPHRRRGPAGDCFSGALHKEYKNRSSLVYKGDMDSSLEKTTISLSKCSLESEFTQSGRDNSISSDFLQSFKDWGCFDDEQDFISDSSDLDIEKAIICSETDSVENPATYKGTDSILPSHLAANTQENNDQNITSGLIRKFVSGTSAQVCTCQGLIPPHIKQIYDELFVIHQKLQRESSAQQEHALHLQKREHFLTEREALLFRHEAALAKIRGVEEEVHTKIGIIKEQHEAEVKQLTEALREITKENRRLKSSFDTLKEMNDSLRKQLSDVTELNKKLEGQARKVQARLENLQRKHEFLMIQKSKDRHQVVQQCKPVKQEKVMVTPKIAKLRKIMNVTAEISGVVDVLQLPLNSQVYELLTYLMDWISDQHLSKIKIPEEREDSNKLLVTQTSKKTCTQERCMKLLPIVAEQLQWMPFVNPKLHVPVIKFIYWSIRQLDTGIQHATIASTMRRLGEDIFKGIGSKGNPHSSSERSTESKSKSAAFFKSSCMPLRFLSTLIVLKTVTQVDYLAQAFDSLRTDLKTDEGKALFLEHQCVPVVLSHLKASSRGLLSSALDGLLQMTMESGNVMVMDNQVYVQIYSSHREVDQANGDKRIISMAIEEKNFLLNLLLQHQCSERSVYTFLTFLINIFGYLQPFLEACSNESFFRTCSGLLRSSKLDTEILEKLCVILQKLSRIKSNRKMFELFSLHQMIQELRRTTNQDHAFLCINLNSILLNLGLSRSNNLASSLSTSP